VPKKSLLLVDGDVRSLRVLEVSLRKAGYNLTTCGSGTDALETLEYATPDLILSDTRLPGMDGFALVEALRQNGDWATIPIMFLSSDTSVESKVKGLQLGVEDYLTKPIYTKEILARIHLALNRRERDSFARGRSSLSKTRFTGSLEDMGLVDLLQTIDVSRKSGVLELRSPSGHGTIEFRDGQILDAELGRIHGERAVYRLLLWNEGDFDIEFRPVRTEARIQTPTTGLLMEGMRRVDEWGRLLEQVPPLDAVLEVVDTELLPRLAEIPDELNPILRAIDGTRTLGDVIDALQADDLQSLSAISKLYFEGVVQPSNRSRTLRPGPQSEEMAVVGGELELEGRANPDVSGAGVPQGGSIVPPPAPAAAQESAVISGAGAIGLAPPAVPSLGTTSATPAMPPPPARPKDPRKTLLGHGLDDDEMEDVFAGLRAPLSTPPPPSASPASTPPVSGSTVSGSTASGSTASGSTASTPPAATSKADSLRAPAQGRSTTDQEDPMAKKNKKNKGSERPSTEATKPEASKRVEAQEAVKAEVPVAAAAPAARPEEKRDEAASNIIQFPTQAKRTVTQVAVNDDVVVGSARDEEPARDETQPRLKTEDERPKSEPPPAKADAKDAKADEAKADAKAESKADAKAESKADAKDEHDDEEHTDAKGKVEDRKERRKKKTPMTESGQMRAIGTGEHAVVTEEFFTAPKKVTTHHHDDFADLQRSLEPMSAQSKQWMWGSIGIFLAGMVVIGAYWYYQNIHMPQPVQLGQAGPVEMPRIGPVPSTPRGETPPAAEATPPTPAPTAAAEPTGLDVPPEVAPTEAAPTEAAPVAEAAPPVEAAPVEAAPVEAAPVEAAPVAAAPVAPAPAAAGETYESVLAEAVAARGAARQIPLLERAIALNPSGADALARLSYIYVGRGGRGNLEQARTYAERATAADPTSSQGWLVLGAARGELGDRVGARAAYQSCVDSGQGRWVTECRAMLR
jgi:CheY-like chemotaxis protein